jgi:hypothetical protein
MDAAVAGDDEPEPSTPGSSDDDEVTARDAGNPTPPTPPSVPGAEPSTSGEPEPPLVVHDAGSEVATEAGSDAEGPPLVPMIDGSRESLIALLESEDYRESPWRSQTDEPRARTSLVSPHGDVRVFANDVLLASIDKGNGVKELPDGTLESDLEGSHDTGSVAVKEFYTDGELVGRAVLAKLEGGQSQAAYYCEGSAERCGTEDDPPIYGVGFNVACGICHGGLVFTVNFPED